MRILILGGAGGIAYNTAKMFWKMGDSVYLGVHTDKERETVLLRHKDEDIDMHVFKIDILNDEDLKILSFIEYDILWIHVGIGVGGSILEMSIDSVKYNYDVNVFGVMNSIRLGYKNMTKRGNGGKIFVTSSLASRLNFPFLGCYTSSKASLSMLVRTIREELKFLKSDVSISLIELGAYHTGFNQVMIDNKEKYLEKESLFYKRASSINRLQRNVFRLMESDNIDRLSCYLVKNMKKKRCKFLLRYPRGQAFFVKLFDIFKG